jgi:NH3-dependent NAD+ synthetase
MNTMNTLRNIFRQPAGRSGIVLGLVGGVVAAVLVTCTKIWQDLPPIKQETLTKIALPMQQKSQQ